MGTAALSAGLFGIVALTATALTIRVMVERRRPLDLRTLGLVALWAVVAYPRAYFYDLILLVIPLAGQYFNRDTYRTAWRRRALWLCAAGAIA